MEILTGPTSLYIYPFGARPGYGDAKYNYLIEQGYNLLSAVGPHSYRNITHGAYTEDRRRIDGMALIDQPDSLRDLMVPEDVLDRENRPARFWKKE